MSRQWHRTIEGMMVRGIVAVTLTALCAMHVWAGPLPPVHHERDLPAKVLAKRVVIYNRPYTGAIYADYVPDVKEVSSPFAPAMAGNEYEPMQVGLYVPAGAKALKNVTLEVKCAIPTQIGHIYYTPPEELDWLADSDEALLKANFPNSKWPCDPKLLVGKRASMPMYVLPVSGIAKVSPGGSAAFWVTFKTDEKIAARTQRGTLTVRVEGKVLETIHFVVQVYPFALPRPKVHYGMYYMAYQTPAAFQGRKFQRLYLADMVAHGMNFMNLNLQRTILAQEGYGLNTSSPVGPPEHDAWGSTSTRLYLGNYLGPQDHQPDGGYNVLKLIDSQVRMGREAGLIQRDHLCVTEPSGFEVSHKAVVLANIQQYSAVMDWPYFLFYMRDEPSPAVFAEVLEHVGEWRRLGVPGIAAMDATAAFGVGPAHSVWTVIAGHITPELLREAERLGADVWAYDCNLRTTNVEASRFNSGLYTWSLGLKGNMPYAYMGESHHQPHFDAEWKLSGPSVLGYVIPSPAGPVPGVGWEGRREGVDDVRYLQLLEARVATAGQDDPTAQEARRWLVSLRDRSQSPEFTPVLYNAWGTDYMDPHSGLLPADYDAIRAEAAGFIMKLASAAGEQNAEPSEWVQMQAKPLETDAYASAGFDECIEALKTGTIKQKRQAAEALALRDSKTIAPALDLLITLLDDPEVRMAALRALVKLGPEAAPAIPSLRKLLTSEDLFVRDAATYTLTQIGQDAEAAHTPDA